MNVMSMCAAICDADGTVVSRPCVTRNLAVSWYAFTMRLVGSCRVDPSQYSCWLGGMNG